MGPGLSQHQLNAETQPGLSTPASRSRDNPLPDARTGRPGTTGVDDPLTSDIAKIIGRIIGRPDNTGVENPGTSDIAKIMPLVVHYKRFTRIWTF